MSYLNKFYEEWHDSAEDNRIEEIRDRDLMALDFLKGVGSVVELGCGSGTILKMFDAPVKAGVDISSKAIEIAREQVGDGVDLQVVDIDAEELQFPSESFDGAMASEVLEHLFDPVHALAEMNRVLKKDGKILITVPNIGYYVYRYYHLTSGEVSDFHGNGLIVNEHIRYYSSESMSKILKLTGFKIERIRGCMKEVVERKGERQSVNMKPRMNFTQILRALRPSPINILSKVNKLFGLWERHPSLFAVGLVVEARKIEESKYRHNSAVDHQKRSSSEEALNVIPLNY